MIGFDPVVAVLLRDVRSSRDQVVDDSQIRPGLIGRHLDRRRSVAKSAGEESAGGGGVSLLRQQHVDDLPVLVHRPVQVPPAAGDLDIGLVDEPPVPGYMPQRAGGVGEQRGEPLHPPVHGDVIDFDTALGQQFLDVPVGEAVTEVPADREGDHLRRKSKPGKRRPLDSGTDGSRSTHPSSLLSQPRRPRPVSAYATDPTRVGGDGRESHPPGRASP
jgi:hypothetical protein